MKQFKIVQKNIIMMGIQEKTYHIDANSAEEAETLVSDGDAEDFCIDIDYDIERIEEMEIESEER